MQLSRALFDQTLIAWLARAKRSTTIQHHPSRSRGRPAGTRSHAERLLPCYPKGGSRRDAGPVSALSCLSPSNPGSYIGTGPARCICARTHPKCDATFIANGENIGEQWLTSSLIPTRERVSRRRTVAGRVRDVSLCVLWINWRIWSVTFSMQNRGLQGPRVIMVQKRGWLRRQSARIRTH
jgi:hypothetical protein